MMAMMSQPLHSHSLFEPDLPRHRTTLTQDDNPLLFLKLLTLAFAFPYFSRANIQHEHSTYGYKN